MPGLPWRPESEVVACVEKLKLLLANGKSGTIVSATGGAGRRGEFMKRDRNIRDQVIKDTGRRFLPPPGP